MASNSGKKGQVPNSKSADLERFKGKEYHGNDVQASSSQMSLLPHRKVGNEAMKSTPKSGMTNSPSSNTNDNVSSEETKEIKEMNGKNAIKQNASKQMDSAVSKEESDRKEQSSENNTNKNKNKNKEKENEKDHNQHISNDTNSDNQVNIDLTENDNENENENENENDKLTGINREGSVSHTSNVSKTSHDSKDIPNNATSVRRAANLSLGCNIILFITKTIVFFLTYSVAVVASLVDSMLDLVSQVIMFWTERNVTVVNENYPVGRTRLEPVGILSVSILMVMSAVTVIRESVAILATGSAHVMFGTWTIITMSLVIAMKFGLWVYCRRFTYSPIAMALAEDHSNDLFSNGIAVIAGVLATNIGALWWVDAIGGIGISFYIIYSWWCIGRDEITKLVGKRASDEMLSEIRSTCEEHHDKMDVDVLRAYHIGRNILVEVEVIMPKDTTLEVAHDVSLELQKKIELYDYVERAFVHVDYQTRGYDEHKKPTLL